MDFPTFYDLFRVGRDEILAHPVALTAEIIEREGTDANALLAGMAAMAEECIAQLAIVAEASYLDSAEKDALRKLVWDRYGIKAKKASVAYGSVQFRTAVAAAAAFAIPVGKLLATQDGRQYKTTNAALYPAGSTGPVTVSVVSVLAGAKQQAKAGTITSIISTIAGSPSDLTVSNAVATVGGMEAETDPSVRQRAREFWTTARRGTSAALEAAARAVTGVETATAFEMLDAFGRPAGFVNVVVTDAFTESLAELSEVPPAYAAQSQALASTVAAAMEDVRACGVFVRVQVARVRLIPVVLALSFRTGVDVDAVALAARAAVVQYINALKPGEPLIPAGVTNALRPVAGLLVTGAEMVSPAGAIINRPLEVLRTTLALVSATSASNLHPLQGTVNPDAFA